MEADMKVQKTTSTEIYVEDKHHGIEVFINCNDRQDNIYRVKVIRVVLNGCEVAKFNNHSQSGLMMEIRTDEQARNYVRTLQQAVEEAISLSGS